MSRDDHYPSLAHEMEAAKFRQRCGKMTRAPTAPIIHHVTRGGVFKKVTVWGGFAPTQNENGQWCGDYRLAVFDADDWQEFSGGIIVEPGELIQLEISLTVKK